MHATLKGSCFLRPSSLARVSQCCHAKRYSTSEANDPGPSSDWKAHFYASLFLLSAAAGSYVAVVLYHEKFAPKFLSGLIEHAPFYESIHQTRKRLVAFKHHSQQRYASARASLQKWSPFSRHSPPAANSSTPEPSVVTAVASHHADSVASSASSKARDDAMDGPGSGPSHDSRAKEPYSAMLADPQDMIIIFEERPAAYQAETDAHGVPWPVEPPLSDPPLVPRLLAVFARLVSDETANQSALPSASSVALSLLSPEEIASGSAAVAQLQESWRQECESKLATLEAEHQKELTLMKAALAAQYREELGRALYYHSQALKHEWESTLQATLNAERQGRLARLESLGVTVSELKHRLDLDHARLTTLELIQHLNTSVNVLKNLLDAEQDLFSLGHSDDMDELASLLSTFNPAAKGAPSTASQAVGEYESMLAQKWKQKSDRESVLFEKEWKTMNRIVDRLGAFVAGLEPAERVHFEPTFALLKATLESCTAHQQSRSPVATPYARLVDEFRAMVPLLRRTSLADSYGSFLSHLLSSFASRVLLFRKSGLVPGLDTESVTARAGYWLEKGDLDLAVRELSHLRERWPQLIAHDWLEKARARLEWAQGLQILQQEMNWLSLQSQ